MNPDGYEGAQSFDERDGVGSEFGGGRRWLPDYHNEDGVAP